LIIEVNKTYFLFFQSFEFRTSGDLKSREFFPLDLLKERPGYCHFGC